MSSQTLADAHFAAFVRHAAVFLKIGFDAARPRITGTTEEVLVTQYIVEGMNECSASGRVPRFLDRFEPTDDVKVSHPDRKGKSRRIIDIRIVRAGKGRPLFEVEAKCLRRLTNPIGDYTGAEGLMLFVNEEYARELPVAGMLGYVQTDEPAYWKAQLEKSLTAKSGLNGLAEELTILGDSPFDHGYRSSHFRVSGRIIAIHHFLVTCC